MPVIASIQYTQDQMRTLTGVSAETVRHWRKTVPYLASKTGKAARFSFSDLLGLAVTSEMVGSLGVHICSVSASVDALFNLLSTEGTAALDGTVVLITSTTVTLHPSGSQYVNSLTLPTLAIPLDPLVARLQQHILPARPASAQAMLPFPLEAVWSKA